MTFPEFDSFFESFIEECRSMRNTKGKEYASSTDRFDNFNRLAKTLEIDRLKIASVYLQKHLDAINTYIKIGKVSSTEGIQGRFIDAVTYLILMAGMESASTFKKKGKFVLIPEVNKMTGIPIKNIHSEKCLCGGIGCNSCEPRGSY